MRVSNVCWGLCAMILASGTAQADGGSPPFGMLDDSPRFMLYVQKQIGGTRHRSTGPSFGFAVDRSMATSTRIFDLRVAPFDDGAIMLNGLQVTGKGPQRLGYEGSYGEGASWNNPWLWFAAALGAAIGISCLTENWPCDDSYDGEPRYTVPGE